MDTNIARTIINQITPSGRMALAARDFIALPDGVQFTAGARHNIRKMRVVLGASDTYTVTTYRRPRGGIDWVPVSELGYVWAENLGAVLVGILDGAA